MIWDIPYFYGFLSNAWLLQNVNLIILFPALDLQTLTEWLLFILKIHTVKNSELCDLFPRHSVPSVFTLPGYSVIPLPFVSLPFKVLDSNTFSLRPYAQLSPLVLCNHCAFTFKMLIPLLIYLLKVNFPLLECKLKLFITTSLVTHMLPNPYLVHIQ